MLIRGVVEWIEHGSNHTFVTIEGITCRMEKNEIAPKEGEVIEGIIVTKYEDYKPILYLVDWRYYEGLLYTRNELFETARKIANRLKLNDNSVLLKFLGDVFLKGLVNAYLDINDKVEKEVMTVDQKTSYKKIGEVISKFMDELGGLSSDDVNLVMIDVYKLVKWREVKE